MNTKLLTKIVRTTVSVIFILGTMLGPMTTKASAQGDVGNILANPQSGYVEFGNCYLSWIYSLNVFDGKTGEITYSSNPSTCVLREDGYHLASFQIEGYTLKAGDSVHIGNDFMLRYLTITPEGTHSVDVVADTIQGVNIGATHLGINVGGWHDVYPNPDGSWRIDLSGLVDLVPGMQVAVYQEDSDGDYTNYLWNIPNPPNAGVFVRLTDNRVEALGWPNGELITLKINGVPYISDQEVSDTVPWDPTSSYFNFKLDGMYTLLPGDTVTVTGESATVTTTVVDLSITSVDPATDMVCGIGNPNIYMNVFLTLNTRVASRGSGSAISWDSTAPNQWCANFAVEGSNDGEVPYNITGRESIEVQQWSSDNTATMVQRSVLNPWILVLPESDIVEAHDWPVGAPLHLTIDDPATADSPDIEQDGRMGANGTTEFNVSVVPYDLKDGDVVTITDDATHRTYIVENLSITSIDIDTDTVTGKANSGAVVYVWPHIDYSVRQPVTIDGNGDWSVSFAGTFDLAPEMYVRSEIGDAYGNYTAIDRWIPNPRFDVRANTDRVEGWDWTIGETLSLEIGGQTFTAVVHEADWDPNTSLVEFSLSGLYDIQPGDVVTLSNKTKTMPATVAKTTTVTELAITNVDVETDIVSGVAAPYSGIDLWASPPPDWQNVNRHVTADENGNWSANFHEVGEGEQGTTDIGPGVWIDTQQVDEDGERTMYGVTVPNPFIDAHPQYDLVYGWEWPLNTELTLTINGEMVATTTMTPTPWDPNSYWADFPLNGFDLLPGQEVTISYDNGTVYKSYKVGDPKLTNIDIQADRISGTGTPGTWLEVWANDPEGGGVRYITIDNSGNWTVDFSTPSDPSDTQRPIDLKPGTDGSAHETNEFGDMTWANDWRVPNPRLVASITEDWIRVEDFAPNATLNYAIYSSKGGIPLLSDTALSDDRGWMNAIKSHLDLVPGNYIEVSDGSTAKDLVIEDLKFESLDLTDGLVLGSAPPPEGRYIWVGIGTETEYWGGLDLYTKPSNLWTGNFNAPVGMNIQWAAAQAFDDDGDASEVRPDLILADVTIDIRPWVDRNLFVCGASGELVPVAVLSTPEFDATKLDAGSVHFGRNGTEAAVILIGKDKKPMKVVADVNKDGLPDIVFTFRLGDTGFKCSDIPKGQQMVNVNGVLTGKFVTTMEDVGGFQIVENIRIDGTDILTLVKILGH